MLLVEKICFRILQGAIVIGAPLAIAGLVMLNGWMFFIGAGWFYAGVIIAIIYNPYNAWGGM